MPAVNVMTEPGVFKTLVTLQTRLWKETGYATIIFLAALLNIDASLYEAAAWTAPGAGSGSGTSPCRASSA